MGKKLARVERNGDGTRGLQLLTRVVEHGSVPARTGRAVCKSLRQNGSVIGLQHQQDAGNERFWEAAPESQLLIAVRSGVLTSTVLCADASWNVVARDLDAVVAAFDERGLLAPAGDTARLQELFDLAVIDRLPLSTRCLFSRHPEIDPTGCFDMAMAWACQGGDAAMVALLLADERVDPAAHCGTALISASRYGHADIVRLLLSDHRVDPECNDNAALLWASAKDHSDVVRLLLEDGRADPSACNSRAFGWACKHGNKDLVQLLLADTRVDPTTNDNEALQSAQSRNHTEVVQLLLADGRVTLKA